MHHFSFRATILQCIMFYFFLCAFIVISLAVQLAELINETGLSLEDLIRDLEVEIQYANSDAHVTSASSAAVNVARSLKEKYQSLLGQIGGLGQRDNLSSGHMLFLAFDSLFNNVEAATVELRRAMLDR